MHKGSINIRRSFEWILTAKGIVNNETIISHLKIIEELLVEKVNTEESVINDKELEIIRLTWTIKELLEILEKIKD